MVVATNRRSSIVILTCLVLLLTACGGGDVATTPGQPSATAASDDVATTATDVAETNSDDTTEDEAPDTPPTIDPTVAAGYANRPTVPPAPPTVPSSFDADGDGFYTLEEFRTATAALLPTYQFPPGFSLTADSLLANAENYPDASFEARGEYTTVGMAYMCAWAQTWVDAFRTGDVALQDESLLALREEASSNPLFTFVREDYNAMIDGASLGDPAPIQNHLNQCSWDVFTEVPN